MGNARVIQFAAELESLECCECGVTFAMPENMLRRARQLGEFKQMFYCPNGHKQGFGESEVARLRKQVEQKDAEIQRQKNDAELWRTRKEETERRLSAQKGITTKLKKRVGHGVCPCCKRTFKQLAQHMAHKHPEYASGNDEAHHEAEGQS